MPVADGAPDCNSLVILGQRQGFTVSDCSTQPPPSGSVILSHVQMWIANSSEITTVQQALAAEGYSITVDGYFGPETKSVYSQWQQSLGFTGSAADGNPGCSSLTSLGNAQGFTVTCDSGVPAGEVAEDYTRISYNGASGVIINQRTKLMLDRAVAALTAYSWTPYLLQGSYNTSNPSSAGTHDGGGVVDIRVSTMTTNGQYLCVQALRNVGWAAWLRTPDEGFSYHIHAVAIGDHEMSNPAADQVQDFFNGLDGLADNGPDTLPSSYPYTSPSWCAKYNR